jgi:hypothetical protein
MSSLSPMEFVKQYARIDESEDESYLTLLIDAAKVELQSSGVPEIEEGNSLYPLYQKAVAIQVLLDYDKYDKSMNIDALKRSLTTIILKLKAYGGDTS